MIWMNQVKEMYSTGGLPNDMRWLIILGDDVYVNTARLYYFLAGHASRDDHPVIFAHAPCRYILYNPFVSHDILHFSAQCCFLNALQFLDFACSSRFGYESAVWETIGQ